MKLEEAGPPAVITTNGDEPAAVPVVGVMAVTVGRPAAAAGVATRVSTGITNEQAMAMAMAMEVTRVNSRLASAPPFAGR